MTGIVWKHPTLPARPLSRLAVATLAAGALLLGVRADAAGTPEQQCQKGRYDAAAKYSSCQQKAAAKFFSGGDLTKHLEALKKCVTKYTATWPKLQAKASGTGASCDSSRFAATATRIFDRLTLLQWEKKTDDASVHDKDNMYGLSLSGNAGDGTAYTVFLSALNGGGCFDGRCDWRVPTFDELQTILVQPCSADPCIDPIFGPVGIDTHWSSTAGDLSSALSPQEAWGVGFNGGGYVLTAFNGYNGYHIRAVRAGVR